MCVSAMAALSIQGETLQARFVVGADGLKSGIRGSAGLDAVKSEKRRYGFRRHYRVAPWSDYVELYWGPRGQFYITPVAANEICVVFISRHAKAAFGLGAGRFSRVARQDSPVLNMVRMKWDRCLFRET